MAATIKVVERDLGWKDIKKDVKQMAGTETRVGVFGNGGDPADNLALRALIQEFGSKRWKTMARYPKGRPFMRQSFDNNLKDLERFVNKEYGKVIDQDQSVAKMISRVGTWMEGKEKDEITQGNFVPLAPATVLAKGSSTPLVDTGQMRNSIKHKDKVR